MSERLGQHWTLYCAVILSAIILRYAFTWLIEHRGNRHLRSNAPKVPTKLPLGLDFIARVLRFNLRCQTLLLWDYLMQVSRDASQTVEVNVGGMRTIMTADPENVKAILTSQFKSFGKGPRFNEGLTSTGIFAADGQLWADGRSMIRGQFVRDRLEDTELLEKHTSELVEILSRNSEIDIKSLIFGYTLDIATDFLLGSSTDSMHHPENEFATAFSFIQKFHNTLARLGPVGKLVPRKELRRQLKVFDAFIEQFVDQALNLAPSEQEEKPSTFLHAIIEHSQDRKFLRDQIASTLLAARDTTACTLCWMLYELSFAPELVSALREEIRESVGKDRTPTFTELKSMRLLQHTIQETLRLYPAVPVNFREALEDSSLPHGGGDTGGEPIDVPKGTPVIYNTHYMQLNEEWYNDNTPDPAVFEPSRWEHWRPRNFAYIPFNAGPRICAGQQFAITELGYTIVRLLQRFKRLEPRGEILRCNPRQPPLPGSCSLAARVYHCRPRMSNAVVLHPADPLTIAFIE